ncbi:hypothetical protein BS50DRAFT_332337 [Corynespora cassiicola Philippines]|uniref:Uncharacterized protein n=1 Tax=Corynespora cassiicola Philippines TaxID=1448308 RepID=A0A2T2NUX5_CORCC|nr:hypothetical protein BS50DRAFT_332337 [Corynespora cassiicola Philippines]
MQKSKRPSHRRSDGKESRPAGPTATSMTGFRGERGRRSCRPYAKLHKMLATTRAASWLQSAGHGSSVFLRTTLVAGRAVIDLWRFSGWCCDSANRQLSLSTSLAMGPASTVSQAQEGTEQNQLQRARIAASMATGRALPLLIGGVLRHGHVGSSTSGATASSRDWTAPSSTWCILVANRVELPYIHPTHTEHVHGKRLSTHGLDLPSHEGAKGRGAYSRSPSNWPRSARSLPLTTSKGKRGGEGWRVGTLSWTALRPVLWQLKAGREIFAPRIVC